MLRTGLVTVLFGLAWTGMNSVSLAQTPGWRFHWQTGQVLTYRVEQLTTASETLGDKKDESKTKLNLVKRWQVQGVDGAGVATLQLSLSAMRMETTTPRGDVLVFDSADPDKSEKNLKEQLSQFVGQPLAVLRIDAKGKVVEVKKSEFGPASRFESQLPFQLVLPETEPKAGDYWQRAYKITLEPPQGTGQKYDAVQRYTCKTVAANAATITVATTLKTMPEALLDRVPLLRDQPEGEIVFDTQSGLMRTARLVIDKELKDHQGEGSSYRFHSTYVEEYAGSK
jgi:hypothetical protein